MPETKRSLRGSEGRGSRGADAESAELAASLLESAGLGGLAAVKPLTDHTNTNYLVTDRQGGRFVLRRFKDRTPPRHSALARMRRECWAYKVLTQAGAPVPRLAASSEEPGAEATLTTLIEGDHLGTLVPGLTPPQAAEAWSSCGRALAAAHSIDARDAEAAGCEQVGITAPDSSRGPHHYEEALTHLDRLAVARADLGDLGELRAAVIDALPLYQRAPLALSQYDAHLWQFLIARLERGEWACTAILDWEHADLDDPDWDLAQLDGFRWVTLGLVPSSFFDGYGRTPSSPLHTLYRVERAAWMLSAYTEGSQWLELSIPLAERLVHDLLAQPNRLRENVSHALAEN